MDEQLLRGLYHDVWQAMIAKDEKALDAFHSHDFVLVHMTGTRQKKSVYIQSILNGTLNYYDEQTDSLDFRLMDDCHALVTGYSVVNAAVYGGSRRTWHLKMAFKAVKEQGVWRFSDCEVSTY